MMTVGYMILLGLVGLERLLELRLSRRNLASALGRGGVEYGQGHFAFMKVLHSLFLVACAAEVLLLDRPFWPALGLPMLALAVAAQALRYWAVRTLGRRWNVRVVVVPGEAAVTGGPYRFIRHPNYLAVILEGIALPLIHGAWITALAFSTLNALLLLVRVGCEERALAEHCQYDTRLGDRGRLVPGAAALWSAPAGRPPRGAQSLPEPRLELGATGKEP